MRLSLILSGVFSLGVVAVSTYQLQGILMAAPDDSRTQAETLLKEGNFAEAYDLFKDLTASPQTSGSACARDLDQAITCLQQLNRLNEVDALVENCISAHADDWRVLMKTAELYRTRLPHDGFLIGGVFERGHHRGGGDYVSSLERDRVRAIQLLLQARPLVEKDIEATPQDRSGFFMELANSVSMNVQQQAWKLQDLTPLDTLPDYEENAYYGRGWGRGGFGGHSNPGASVNENGDPVFHAVPESWQAATSDGERWRWALREVVRSQADRESEVDLLWARFLQSQFGVQTADVAYPEPRHLDEKSADETDGVAAGSPVESWVIHKLPDIETIARLANGTRQFTLPDEFNHVLITQKVIDRKDDQQSAAVGLMIQIRMNRHQYPQTAELLDEAIRLSRSVPQRQQLRRQHRQIVEKWVQIESLNTQAAGEPAVLDIRFRNGSKVNFVARPIIITKLLDDTKKYLESRPERLDHIQTQIEQLGYRLINTNGAEYLGDPVAEWEEPVEAPENHFDARVSVKTPLTAAGAYWVEATIDGGNTSRVVLWIADTALTRKHVEGGTLCFVSDAVTGKPIARANLEFFGFRTERLGNTADYQVITRKFADRTNDDGIAIISDRDVHHQQWLTVARTADGRLAYHGFGGLWQPQQMSEFQYNPIKVYTVTDRPVYRPSHELKFRLWARRASFHDDGAEFANQSWFVQIVNPMGDIVEERAVTTDRWGGVDGTWTIAEDAVLGDYSLNLCHNVRDRDKPVIGSGSFRVEEYRKPEFKVTIDAPEKPVKLGDKITAEIDAQYYFGAPVTEGTLHYKVERTKKDQRWYPVGRWDWLYSPGYWWFAPDAEYYPGWKRWGCFGPVPPWLGWSPDPPEVVAEGDASLNDDGTFSIDIDTANALRDHSDSDHSYRITAEVVDQSRRTISASGEVIVARDPFQVFTWTDRGHYQTGDTVEVSVQARTPDGKAVAGKGKAVLYAVNWNDDDTVQEASVETIDFNTDKDGSASLKFVIPDAGQYRISCSVTDDADNTMEGASVLYVRGPQQDGQGYRFNDLEIIPDKREYKPGETAKLQINTNHADSTVLLFVRPMNGLCPAPEVIRIGGKSTTYDLKIAPDDMPNIYVEALTIADGRLHSIMKELFVPPEEKVANVELLPSKEEFRPGETAKVQLKLTDERGQPFVGDTILSVFDASLEYIAASTIPEIRSFFWDVRRYHNIQVESTLQRQSYPVLRQGEESMTPLSGGQPVPSSGQLVPSGKRGRGAGGLGGAPMMEMAAPMSRMMADDAMDGIQATAASTSPEGGTVVEPAVRSEFADTALWIASKASDADGIVTAEFKVPDNLTTWTIRAWALGDGTRVGSGSTDIICSKDLIIRPQTPRFFTEKDQITLSAVVHNYLDSAKDVQVILETEGGQLRLLDAESQTVNVAAGGETRVDWLVDVVASGKAVVRMKALTDEESDAAEITVPAHVHGILKTESIAGVIRPDQDTETFQFTVPTERIEAQSRLEIRYSPSLAGAMVDALPYLLDYPYGCTEQTLNRFLPAVLTQRTLQKMGINLEDIRDKRTNLNAQQLGDAKERATQWKSRSNPVFDTNEMNTIVRDGLRALTDMQLSDGGWGWFSGYGERSSAHLTAQVVHGLTIAERNDVPVLSEVVQDGIAWLTTYQKTQLERLREGDWRREHPDELEDRNKDYRMQADNVDAFVAWVLSEHDSSDPAMTDYLFRDRGSLSVYAMCLTGLVLDAEESIDRRDLVLRNIEQFLQQDDENQTAWLKLPGQFWWYWYESENEAHAMYLKLLLKVRPEDRLASRVVKYLLNNRRSAGHWNSTRDTALVVEALADYITVTREDKPDMTVEVYVDGQLAKRVRISPDNFFSFDNVVVFEGDAVKAGARKIEIRRTGTGPVYFNAYLTNFTKEDPITAAGLEVKVTRRYYRLERDDRDASVRGDLGQVVKQQSAKWKRIPLQNLDSVASGDLIEVELLVDSKNDYEYLMLEDRKPSGFEPDDQRSGYVHEGLRAYRELRDDRVTFFLSDLARGNHSVSYRLRAETPGRMAALPARIVGMYAPELVGNSDEFKLRVTEAD